MLLLIAQIYNNGQDVNGTDASLKLTTPWWYADFTLDCAITPEIHGCPLGGGAGVGTPESPYLKRPQVLLRHVPLNRSRSAIVRNYQAVRSGLGAVRGII